MRRRTGEDERGQWRNDEGKTEGDAVTPEKFIRCDSSKIENNFKKCYTPDDVIMLSELSNCISQPDSLEHYL